uniref:Uncharacterized protein n=1 Tax=Octopus bimaculoides TaxID=37653 RepID=A0A0L8GQ85_OCTBM
MDVCMYTYEDKRETQFNGIFNSLSFTLFGGLEAMTFITKRKDFTLYLADDKCLLYPVRPSHVK